MSEAQEYAGMCPVCGGLVYMQTREDDEVVEVDYICHTCNRLFDDTFSA